MITERHFGSHILFTKDITDDEGPFQRFSDKIGAHSYRYPGGTVTEGLSPSDGSWDEIFGEPGDPGENGRIVTVREAFEFAGERGAGIRFVLPTENFLTEGPYGQRYPNPELIDQMMSRVDQMIRGDFGDVRIESFEIGNEYWLNNSRMTAQEYGRIANYMAKELQQRLDAHRAEIGSEADEWHEPAIAVQSGAFWRSTVNESSIILSELDMGARDAIDAVVAHNYPDSYEAADQLDRMFSHLSQFENAPGMSDLDIYISEWNQSSSTTDVGLRQPSGILAQFDEMIRSGVDDASIWGTTYKDLPSRLAYVSQNEGFGTPGRDIAMGLTPAGEIYRMMTQSLVGKSLLGLNGDDVIEGSVPSNLSVHSYGNSDQVVIFLSSRSDQPMTFDLDYENIMPGFGHVFVSRLGVIDDPRTAVNEGDPENKLARPKIDLIGQEELKDSDGMINLQAFGLLRITISKPGVGVLIEGHDQISDPGLDMSDAISGAAGNDTLLGHFGNDTISAQGGNDLVDGGAGNDSLSGGDGADVLVGGDGNDIIIGGRGGDVLIGGNGEDTLIGGEGGGVFVPGTGNAMIQSGDGPNIFSLTGDGIVRIEGFDPLRDVITFGGRFGTPADIMRSSIIAPSGDPDVPGDLVITHGDGQTIIVGGEAFSGLIEGSLMDGSAPEEILNHVSLALSGMDSVQAAAIAEATSTENGSPLFPGTPEQIDDIMPPKVALGVNHIIHPDHVSSHDPGPAPFPEDVDVDGPVVITPTDPKPPNPDDNDGPDPRGPSDLSCFVATAVYGDWAHPDVSALRRFRDDVLVRHPIGRAFIKQYWRFGPAMASFVSGSPALSSMAKYGIGLLVSAMRKNG